MKRPRETWEVYETKREVYPRMEEEEDIEQEMEEKAELPELRSLDAGNWLEPLKRAIGNQPYYFPQESWIKSHQENIRKWGFPTAIGNMIEGLATETRGGEHCEIETNNWETCGDLMKNSGASFEGCAIPCALYNLPFERLGSDLKWQPQGWYIKVVPPIHMGSNYLQIYIQSGNAPAHVYYSGDVSANMPAESAIALAAFYAEQPGFDVRVYASEPWGSDIRYDGATIEQSWKQRILNDFKRRYTRQPRQEESEEDEEEEESEEDEEE